jgi:hypothetical protein
MMGLASWLNTGWMLLCAGEARAFRRATRQVEQTQTGVLREILLRNRTSEFGEEHGFARIDTPRQYQARVPLSTSEDYAAPVRRIASGDPDVLTAEPVLLLEPTSGTTGGEKLIPYTASLRRQFQRGVAAWMANLLRHRPAVRRGRAYWSISPAFGPPRCSAGGIPIGFEDDAAYLGTLEQVALRRLLVVPPLVARLTDLAAFRYQTLLYLLRAEDLTLISVWNPTFLTALLTPLEEWQDRLCSDLRRDTDAPSAPRRRADFLNAVFRERVPLAEKLRRVWPRLALISCWTDAGASRQLSEVREFFPGVEIQGKGLLATEGCVSFPLVGRPAPVLAVRSHFFEFKERGEPGGACRLAHELDRGGRYEVVLTTGGGLYRYQLRDEVEVVGFEQQCPLLRFLGKADRTSDLVGEKLAEPHVRAVLDRVFAAHDVSPRFALLVPVEGRPAHYRLYLQAPAPPPHPGTLATALQVGLEENPHYAYAVRLGQLGPVEVQCLDPEGVPAWSLYEQRALARGQKAGVIKPTALDSWPGWPEVFGELAGSCHVRPAPVPWPQDQHRRAVDRTQQPGGSPV